MTSSRSFGTKRSDVQASSPFQVWVRDRFPCLGCDPDWRRARGPDSWTVRESLLRCARSHRLLVDGVQLLFDG